jgi:phosphoribosylformimino-5-aminoimidazole carboxamide ribotide isomerase
MSEPVVLVAIDIVEDQVVRLRRGEFKERTIYGYDPVETAVEWAEAGAEWLHVVDLDGAAKGEASNSKAIEQIIQKVSIPVQVGGGIRTTSAIGSWVDAGAERVIVGTKALDPGFLREATKEFGDKVVAAVDARQGEVRVAGWQEGSGQTTIDVVQQLAGAGVARVMFTDIERDGMLTGPNIDVIEEVIDALDIPVIVSGGVTTAHDVRMLAGFASKGLEGIIIGKALYSGALKLDEAKEALKV